MKRLILVGALTVFALPSPARGAEIPGTVTKVIDGDTFDLRTVSGRVRIRFCGIDTPERGRPGFRNARVALERMIDGKAVRCVPVGQGTPCDGRSRSTNRDRIVAQCFLGPTDVATEMVRSGYACDWPKFSGGHYKVSAGGCVRN